MYAYMPTSQTVPVLLFEPSLINEVWRQLYAMLPAFLGGLAVLMVLAYLHRRANHGESHEQPDGESPCSRCNCRDCPTRKTP